MKPYHSLPRIPSQALALQIVLGAHRGYARGVRLIVGGLFAILLAVSTANASESKRGIQIMVNDHPDAEVPGTHSRTYDAHIPRGLRERGSNRRTWPIIIDLHQTSGSASTCVDNHGWLDVIDDVRESFILLCPEGEESISGNQNRSFRSHFNDVSFDEWVDDEAFVEALIDLWTNGVGPHKGDPERVFLVGMSAGGQLVHMLASERGELFAAAAVIATNLATIINGHEDRDEADIFPIGSATTKEDCPDDNVCVLMNGDDIPLFVPTVGQTRIPMSIFHGTSDAIRPFNGGETDWSCLPNTCADFNGRRRYFQPAIESAVWWADANGCSWTSSQTFGTGLETNDYITQIFNTGVDCTEVRFTEVIEWFHVFQGSGNLDTKAEMTAFFDTHGGLGPRRRPRP